MSQILCLRRSRFPETSLFPFLKRYGAKSRLYIIVRRNFLSSCGVVSRMSLPRCSKMTRLAMASTSSIIWVEMMTMLRSPYCLIKLRMENFWLGSRPSVGSSKMSILGRCSSAPAMPTRRLYPLERVSHFRLMTSSNSSCLDKDTKLSTNPDG